MLEQIAHIKALYAVHPDSYGETEGPPSIAGALVYEADTTMGQREARDGIRRLTDVLKHHPPFGRPNDLRREEVQAAIEKLNELLEDPANRRLKEHYERLLKDDRRVREHLRPYFSQGPSSIKEMSAGFKYLNPSPAGEGIEAALGSEGRARTCPRGRGRACPC